MAKYVIFKTDVPHFRKEGNMERKQIGSFGWKKQNFLSIAVESMYIVQLVGEYSYVDQVNMILKLRSICPSLWSIKKSNPN